MLGRTFGRKEAEPMLRVTDDLMEVRHWAEHRGGRPCRRPDGIPCLSFAPDDDPPIPVGWDEFEAAFVLGRFVLAYDDAPGCKRCYIGTEREVRAFVSTLDPRTRGADGPTP